MRTTGTVDVPDPAAHDYKARPGTERRSSVPTYDSLFPRVHDVPYLTSCSGPRKGGTLHTPQPCTVHSVETTPEQYKKHPDDIVCVRPPIYHTTCTHVRNRKDTNSSTPVDPFDPVLPLRNGRRRTLSLLYPFLNVYRVLVEDDPRPILLSATPTVGVHGVQRLRLTRGSRTESRDMDRTPTSVHLKTFPSHRVDSPRASIPLLFVTDTELGRSQDLKRTQRLVAPYEITGVFKKRRL